jgi:hypothetical protein
LALHTSLTIAISQLSFNHTLAEGGREMFSRKPCAFDFFREVGEVGKWGKWGISTKTPRNAHAVTTPTP